MIERLANVLYWIGSGLAAILLIAGTSVFLFAGSSMNLADRIGISAFFLGFALLSWLIGKASRYILAGK